MIDLLAPIIKAAIIIFVIAAGVMIGIGFRFVTIANDSGLMAKAAREAVAATRKAAGDVAAA